MISLALAAYIQTAGYLEIYKDPFRFSPPEYDERTLSHPVNPGPKIIIADPPAITYDQKNLHLPDPICIAGCDGKAHIPEKPLSFTRGWRHWH